ncbi:MAG TPA: ATP-dependent DNA helicase, partial [Symbiobacteriaceae bacterium]|nr:ATP-dependent DNA helicase [Symbiobacteriaceae bacterium]
MQIRWTTLPFVAHTKEAFGRELAAWLGRVFYEILPAQGYEVREEQIYTTFRIARAFAGNQTLLAEAGSGTGKTFAYLLPAVCYARYTGKPVVVASATEVLQAQLINPKGDIQTLSRLLGLEIDARLAADPASYLCQVKVNRFFPERRMKGWKALQAWTRRTTTGARSEVPDAPDELWDLVAWDPTLPCDTCRHRGTCHVMTARKEYRAAGDLVVTDHRLFAGDLLTRAERSAVGQMPLLPPYSAVVLDEGHHVAEIWQKAQGFHLNSRLLTATLDLIDGFARKPGAAGSLADARRAGRDHLAEVLVAGARRAAAAFMDGVLKAAEPGEGKRHIPREGEVTALASALVEAVEALQDDLSTEEAMLEGTDTEQMLQAYQNRLDAVTEALALFQDADAVPWVEGADLWVVPHRPERLFGPGRLRTGTPVIFSSATLAPEYTARALELEPYGVGQVGVPFQLASQVLVYQPASADDEVAQVEAVAHAMGGRTLVLLNSLAEVQRYRQTLKLPWPTLYEGDTDRGAMLGAFRADVASCMVGATFWEGVDVPGEALSCVVIPRLPFPAHDPLIRHRRREATARGENPFLAVDLPEMLMKLKQGAGRLIRSAQDRGVIA